MKFYKSFAYALPLLMFNVYAQNFYDSTGGSRLWAPTPSATNTPNVVNVPGSGDLTEGTILTSYRRDVSPGNTCSGLMEYGICVVKSGATGYRGRIDINTPITQLCPKNTYNIIMSTSQGGLTTCDGD